MVTSRESANLNVWAVYGPPRPVLVVGVHGEIDRFNDVELWDRVAEVSLSGQTCRQRYGVRALAATVVIDLRETRFVAISVLARLGDHARHHQRPLRLLLDPDTALGRAVERVVTLLNLDLELHHDLADAVLTGVSTTEPPHRHHPRPPLR